MKLLMRHVGVCCLTALMAIPTWGQNSEDGRVNQITVDASVMSRGELRYGGLPRAEEDAPDYARFIIERTRLGVGYSRKWLELKVTAQHSGVWGQQGKGSLNLFETWVKLKANNGLFAQIGRQELNYDDERILGRNDWAMAANSHDAVRLGYEGHGHKAHLIMAYNQKAESTNGGSTYTTESGAYPHKSLIVAWYHYDLPRIPLGVSALFMNVGMQSPELDAQTDQYPSTKYQQLVGAYVKYHPERWTVEGAYYHQMGHDEFNIPISAWMASIKASYQPISKLRLTTGFDYLSGDSNPIVPKIGNIGLVRHDKVCGFNTVYGSHHKFYGAMDFFYVSAFYGGYTPGLQNLYLEATYTPIKSLSLMAGYHYLSSAKKISEAGRTLGHELELQVTYSFMKDAQLGMGYSFMNGSKTLERLQRVENKNHLHWAWLMLSINPRIFTSKW